MATQVARRLAAIVFMDVVGFSRLMEKDEIGTFQRLLALQNDVVKPAAAAHGGRLVKAVGDGFLVECPDALDAFSFAVAVNRTLATREADLDHELQFQMRTGMHFGEVIEESGDIFGENVNIAARLERLAEAKSIAISETVVERLSRPEKLALNFLGRHSLKNIAREVSVYLHKVQAIELQSPANLRLPDKPSIVVLPFANMSRTVDNELFIDGLCEDIITEMSRMQGMFVIARNTSFVYKGRNVDVRQVSADLGIRYLLEGSVRSAGNRLRVTAQLIDATRDAHLWANRFDCDQGDVFEVQDRITRAVIGCVGPELLLAEYERVRRRQPESLDAWGLYVQALFLCSQLAEQPNAEAIGLCKRAIAIDPHYAQPYGLISWMAVWRAFQGWLSMPEALEMASDAITRARALDKNELWACLGEAMLSYATRETERALAATQQAIDINPNMAFARSLHGLSLALTGRAAEALPFIDEANRLSPKDTFSDDFHLHYAFAYIGLQDYASGLEHGMRSHRGRPKHPYPVILSMICAAYRGEHILAAELSAKLQQLAPFMTREMLLATCPYYQTDDAARFAEGIRLAGHP